MINGQRVAGRGRIAVLLSGRGSNFEAIYGHSQKTGANFEIAVVISDKADARGLQRAKDLLLPAFFVPVDEFKNKRAYENHILDILAQYRVDLICLAGYMRLVGGVLLGAFKNRILNIHPALLPSFPGLDAQQQALNYGVKVSGCTVHFVDDGVDSGPIIGQRAVHVMADDNVDTLGARILKEEHGLYSEAISLFFAGRLKIAGRRVIMLSP